MSCPTVASVRRGVLAVPSQAALPTAHSAVDIPAACQGASACHMICNTNPT